MAGVVFIISIPTEKHEINLAKKIKKKVVINEASPCDSGRSTFEQNKAGSGVYKGQIVLPTKICDDESTDASKINKVTTNISMQKVMEDILKQLNIENYAWSHNLENHFIQIIFTIESGALYEEALDILKEYNIGQKFGSVVSVIPCSLYYKGQTTRNEKKIDEDDVETIENSKDSGWTRFVSSVRARLTVAQVVENIKTDAALTFDFICLVTIATIVCAIGLVENNNVYLLSSMLISPMMGPVMAGTFGSVVRDRMLQKMGVQNELIGLGIATLTGFCYGAIVCACTDRYGESNWPTSEMTSRGELRTLGVGCLIALLSGAAVALGVLSDNIASLVGVAISTSLMPPAVNAGLLWSVAAVYYIKGNETTRYSSLTYSNYYFDNTATELTSLGAVSLCLTFVNIICIYAAGILVFKIKEVAPLASRDHIRRQFWKHDIKIARDFNKILHSDDDKSAHKHFAEDFSGFNAEQCINREFHVNLLNNHFHHSTDLTHNNDKINVGRSQYTWSPCSYGSKRPTVRELEDLYSNLIREKPGASCILNISTLRKNSGRRLSQVFPPIEPKNKCTKSSNEMSIPIREITRDNEAQSATSTNFLTKKFIVTPCSLDE